MSIKEVSKICSQLAALHERDAISSVVVGANVEGIDTGDIAYTTDISPFVFSCSEGCTSQTEQDSVGDQVVIITISGNTIIGTICQDDVRC